MCVRLRSFELGVVDLDLLGCGRSLRFGCFCCLFCEPVDEMDVTEQMEVDGVCGRGELGPEYVSIVCVLLAFI